MRLKYKDGHETDYVSGRTTKGNSSGRIMRLVPVFILETHNPDELQNICPSSSRRKCVLSIKTVIDSVDMKRKKQKDETICKMHHISRSCSICEIAL